MKQFIKVLILIVVAGWVALAVVGVPILAYFATAQRYTVGSGFFYEQLPFTIVAGEILVIVPTCAILGVLFIVYWAVPGNHRTERTVPRAVPIPPPLPGEDQ